MEFVNKSLQFQQSADLVAATPHGLYPPSLTDIGWNIISVNFLTFVVPNLLQEK